MQGSVYQLGKNSHEPKEKEKRNAEFGTGTNVLGCLWALAKLKSKGIQL